MWLLCKCALKIKFVFWCQLYRKQRGGALGIAVFSRFNLTRLPFILVLVHQRESLSVEEPWVNKVWCPFHLPELLPIREKHFRLYRHPPPRWHCLLNRGEEDEEGFLQPLGWTAGHPLVVTAVWPELPFHYEWNLSVLVPAVLAVRELQLKQKQWDFSLLGGKLTEQQANIHPGGSGETSKLPHLLQACSSWEVSTLQRFYFICLINQVNSPKDIKTVEKETLIKIWKWRL